MTKPDPRLSSAVMKIKVDSTHGWIKAISGIFNLSPEHTRFVAMLVAVMYRDEKTKIDTQVREEMIRIHGLTRMYGVYRILTRLKKEGVVLANNTLHPVLAFRDKDGAVVKKRVTIIYEQKEDS